ncbi:elongin-B-like [Varroa jacobsoni]|uniref:Ubiquitin-like domain-containing protein n=1 Tax=Varroa destructor TaxID=109461 RepID=A0A7M7JWU0_VARDE|nr:elongin-B-like [Varroa destructor]XP_022658322.1 elongin-B-like [Varroa destructor]XP_022697544.1 elongin-B-like [Varroa jacobsoni]XP_022697546.1 elongin-B-like [Varroa jacobsoni]
MDVFVMVRRKQTTLFLDAKETTPVLDLKKMIHGILKIKPEEQRLYHNDIQMDDNKTLTDCGLNANSAKAQAPATIGLAVSDETLEITPLSSPPELPDVMKSQDSAVDPACA